MSHSLSAPQPVWSGPLGARNMNDTPPAPPQPCLGVDMFWSFLMFYCAAGTIDPEPRRTQITALARQSWSLHVLSRDCLFLLLTSDIRLGCFANSRVICPACSQQVLCVPVMFPKLSPRPSHCSRGLFQARKERSYQALTAHVLHLPALSAPPNPSFYLELSAFLYYHQPYSLRKLFSQEGSDKLVHPQA